MIGVISHDHVILAGREGLAGKHREFPRHLAIIKNDLGATGEIAETTQESFLDSGL